MTSDGAVRFAGSHLSFGQQASPVIQKAEEVFYRNPTIMNTGVTYPGGEISPPMYNPQTMSTPIQYEKTWKQPNDTGGLETLLQNGLRDLKIEIQLSRDEVKREVMTNIQQLKDQVGTFENSVKYAMASLDSMTKTVQPLQHKVKSLEQQVNALRRENGHLQQAHKTQGKRIAELEAKSKLCNLLFKNVKQEGQREDCKKMIYTIIRNQLEVDIDHIEIQACYRLPVQGNAQKPILVVFQTPEQRMQVWSERKRLAGTILQLAEDLPLEHRLERQQLYPVYRQAKEMQLKAYLNGNKLQIENRHYTVSNLHKLPHPELLPENIATRRYGVVTAFFTAASPFSNFYPSQIELQGKTFLNVEQYFQYQKAVVNRDETKAKQILDCESPNECKAIGNKVHILNGEQWANQAITTMKEGCTAKFTQNLSLKQKLISTGEQRIAEASLDKFWGTGLVLRNPNNSNPDNWEGLNHLGKILEGIRVDLKRER